MPPEITRTEGPFWTQWDFWVAIFTLLLVAATIWLAVEARRTLSEARTSSRQQLRAYVGPSDATMTRFGDNNYATAIVRLKNFGQTPAYGLKGWIGMACVNFPIMDADLPNPPDNLVMPGRFLGTGVDHFMSGATSRALTPQEVLDVRQGRKTIIVRGAVTYDDIYGRSQRTSFSVEYGGTFGTPLDGALTPTLRDNDAT